MSAALGAGYFDRYILFHTHIAKSAGTSILHALTHILGPAHVMNRNRAPDPDSAVPALSADDRRALKMLSGHFWYGRQDRYFERRAVYIAAVRDPIERFISLYRFVLAGTAHPLHREFQRRGPDASARWFFIDNPRFSNEMTHSLGVPASLSPIDWIEDRYAIVAPTARVDSLIARLYEIFAPDSPPRLWRSNALAGPGLILDPATVEECRAAAARDLLLCRQVEARYDEWLHDLDRRLQPTEPAAP